MGITLNSNIPSLLAQRRLGRATSELGDVSLRLSSGLRINRASDDAAGLSIASSLKADAAVYNQGVRNFGDGVSLLNIADGALSELSSILIRQRELASQAANGTLSATQRKALHLEAKSLTEEYNRISDSTEFNSLKLLSSPLGVSLQGGYGANGSIDVALGSQFSRSVGDGTFAAGITGGAVAGVSDGIYRDINGDGKIDALVASDSGNSVKFLAGNGDGTFGAAVTVVALPSAKGIILNDLNGDGILDLAGVSDANYNLYTALGNGDGTFKAARSFTSNGTFIMSDLDMGDVNGDGKMDAIVLTQNRLSIMLGNGDGTFGAGSTLGATISGEVDVELRDINNDGKLDIVTADGSENSLSIYMGNGNGTFAARRTITLTDYMRDVHLVDFDLDGNIDIVATDAGANQVNVLRGNGDGTFKARNSYNTASTAWTRPFDMNGDGYLDLVSGGGPLTVFLNDGRGSFTAGQTIATAASLYSDLNVADLNGDGVGDIISAHTGAVNILQVFLGNSTKKSSIGVVNLTTSEDAKAAFTTIDAALTRVNRERATIGAGESRLGFATSNLRTSQEGYLAAASRIVDADIATEAANLVSVQIRQKAAAAILAQANQGPALTLKLLSVA